MYTQLVLENLNGEDCMEEKKIRWRGSVNLTFKKLGGTVGARVIWLKTEIKW
jgi:hypothetical protein